MIPKEKHGVFHEKLTMHVILLTRFCCC